MKHTNSALISLLLAGCLMGSISAHAAEPVESYGDVVGHKLLSGLANITTGIAEVPKNIIIVNNQSNFAYGLIGGSLKGILHMAGRMGVGMLDLFTAPIPTYPIVDPVYVWDDYFAETTYGPAFVGVNTR